MLNGLASGQVGSGPKIFNLERHDGKLGIVVGSLGKEHNPLPREANDIEVGSDVSSLIFLHACDQPGQLLDGFHEIYNTADTAELLGWYEVQYRDGLVETIPIRYGVNILDWRGQALYGADVVECARMDGEQAAHFYAFEWRNPRFGRKIQAVHLRGASGFRKCQEWYGVTDECVPSNAVILLAISAVEPRKTSHTFGTSTQGE